MISPIVRPSTNFVTAYSVLHGRSKRSKLQGIRLLVVYTTLEIRGHHHFVVPGDESLIAKRHSDLF